MSRPAGRVGPGYLLLVLLLGGLPAAAGAASPVPRPCFVPPHPLKQGLPPRIQEPLPGPDVPTIPVGGSAFAYRDDHLASPLGAGVLPPPETLRTLVLLVDFNDRPMTVGLETHPSNPDQGYFDRVLLFLDQMYGAMSGGQVSLDWDLTDRVYRLPRTMVYYGLDDSIATREADLCRDAVRAADPDVDFSLYDRFMLFHAGEGQEADISDNSRGQIWSVFFRTIDFQYWLTDPDCVPGEFSPDCPGIRTDDADPATGGPFHVPHMVVLPESESQDGFEFGLLGVVAHEFGHSFGHPDLYDTTAEEDFIFADSQGIGAFGLMGAGIWNENGFFPAEMCVWSKFYAGWIRPRVIRPTGNAEEISESLAAVQLDRAAAAVRIPLGGDEYFLIENRLHDYNRNGELDFDDANGDGKFDFWDDSYAGAEFDWYLPQELSTVAGPGEDGSGLLIWHIDESIVRDLLLFNLVNAEALHKGVDLEEADGIQDLDKLEFTFEAFGDSRDSFWAPHAVAFTPHTTPDTDGYNGAFTGIWITDISGPGETMTFRIRFQDPEALDTGDLRAGWPRDLPGFTAGFQPVAGDLDGDGVREIVIGCVDTSGYGGLVVLNPDGTSFFDPGSGPALSTWGRLRSDPILVNVDGNADPDPEMVWVSAETLYVRNGDGTYVGEDGLPRAAPVPYYRFAQDPGRIRLSAGHLENPAVTPACGAGPAGDNLPEILVGVRSPLRADYTDVLAVAFPLRPGVDTTHPRVAVSLPGDARERHHTLADIDDIDGGLKEVVSSVRHQGGGYLAVTLYDIVDEDVCAFDDVRCIALSPGDSVAFTAPVAGDLDRDGSDEIVVGDSEGYVHAIKVRVRSPGGGIKEVGFEGSRAAAAPAGAVFDNTKFEELSGWPVHIGVLEDDELSLADVDGDGLLEVLAVGGDRRMYIIEYNGVVKLTLPVEVPAENRFEQPFLSPLVLDVAGDDGPELVLPLPDGQVRGHDLLGRPLGDWVFIGGGNQGTYPEILDLENDGILDLVSVEDITVAVPDDDVIREGDESAAIRRKGRVVVREVGSATGSGSWPVHRAGAMRSGRAVPVGEIKNASPGGLLDEAFVVPNPVVAQGSARFHYLINDSVQDVKIEVVSASGQSVARLEGTLFQGTSNMVSWNLANHRGNRVAPGLYLARFQAQSGSGVEVRIQPFVVVR